MLASHEAYAEEHLHVALDEHLERPLQGERRALKLNGGTVIDLEELEVTHQADLFPDSSYVTAKTESESHFLNDSLSLNCLNSSVSSFRTAVITRPRALSCSIRAFCLSLFFMAF